MEKLRKGCGLFISSYCKAVLIVFLMLFTLMLFPGTSPGDEIKFEHITAADGLSQNSIFCIIQDREGFMWFGTQHGLNRYDGHDFKLYDNDPRKSGSVSDNLVISLYEDRSGFIWVGTWGSGLNGYDPRTEKFMVYEHDPGNINSISDNNIWSIYEDGKGILWVGTEKGLNKFDRKSEEFKHYLEKCAIESKGSNEPKDNRINVIFQDSSGVIWIGADDGLHEYNRVNDKFTFHSHQNSVNAIYEYNAGSLWIGTEGGLYKFSQEEKEFFPEDTDGIDDLKDSRVSSFCKDRSGILWIGTMGDGLYSFNIKEKRFTHNKSDPNNPDSLNYDEIRAIYKDREGVIWIGTNGGGINLFDPLRKKFALHRNGTANSKSLSHKDVMAICKGNAKEVWVGTRGGGLDEFHPETGNFTQHKIPYSVSQSPKRHIVRAVCRDHLGILWIGTERAGLFTFNPEKKKFDPYLSNHVRHDEYILSIIEDRDGVLWVGTMDNGLIKIEKNRKESKNYKHDPDKNSLSNNKVFSIFEDSGGILWVGTSNGLNRFDKKKNYFTHYRPSGDNPGSLSHHFISAIYEDTKGNFWVGTNGGGLNKFDRQEEKAVIYTTRKGLPDNVIYDILEDEAGNLWLSTNKGLSRFDLRTEKFRNYTVRDGLQGYEFNRGAVCRCEVQKMYFGGVNGLNVFNPGKIKEKDRTEAPPVVVTSIKKGEKEVDLEQSATSIGKLDLPYDYSSISFEFAALSFVHPDRNQYAYKLEPVDKDWVSLGNKHDLDLVNMEPGDYILRVKGSNSDGTWNDEGKSIQITVHPPYWKTWRFYILLTVFIGGTVLSLVRWRMKNIKEANIKLKKEVDERQQAEERLKESEESYRTLVETSPDAITLCDIKGNIIMTNRQSAVLLGYGSAEEMQKEAKSIFRLLTQEDRTRARRNAEKVLEKGVTTNTELDLLAKDGTKIPVEISSSLIKDREGNPRYFLEMARDIRERKEAEKQKRLERERLTEVDKMVTLGTLVSGVAHELNNPVSSIKMNSEIFSRAWEDIVPVLDQYYEKNKDFSMANLAYKEAKTKFEELILGFMESAQRIKKIIDDLRDFSRPKDPFSREPLDISKVMESSIRLTDNMIRKSTQKFRLNLAQDLPLVEGNFHKLEQVFINLIQNACQALADNSKGMEISTLYEKTRRQVVVKIADEGAGIAEESKKHIADPFYTTRRDKGGTGLGLSIAMQIIQEHGGHMDFESSKGQGTTVTVTLPMG